MMKRKTLPRLIAPLSVWLASLFVASAAGVTGPALLPAAPSTTAGTDSFSASMSPDARFVLFLSRAGNLVTNDAPTRATDVFLRDRQSGVITLVSVNRSGNGGGNADSITPSASADGRWMTFASAAADLVAGDSNGVSDVFLRDLPARTTIKVSTTPTGDAANFASENPQISQDGRVVVYESQAGNLIADATNSTREIFLYDLLAETNRRLSTAFVPPGAMVSPNGPAHSATLTPDARQVAYVRSGTNRIGQEYVGEILSWNSESGATFWISEGVTNQNLNPTSAFCFNPTLSRDGSVVVFKNAPGDGTFSILRRSNPPQSNVAAEVVGSDATLQGWATVSADGQVIAYQATDGIRLWDSASSSNRLVLAHQPYPSRRWCSQPTLSSDGRRLIFLVTSNDAASIHLHDRLQNTTSEVAVKETGAPACIGDAMAPLLSDDGRTVIFDSWDESLVEGDANRAGDVFAFDFETAHLDCISIRSSERPGVTPSVPSQRWPGSISADGRVVAVSVPDLGGNDTNRYPDIYVRELAGGRPTFLGRSTNSARYPALSADGRYAATLSTSLDAFAIWATEQTASAWRHDLDNGGEILIHPRVLSHRTTPCVAISPDGNQVAFVTRSFNEFSNGRANLYVHDVAAGITTLASPSYLDSALPPPVRESNGDVLEPRFSPDGRWILYGSSATDLMPGAIPSSFGLYARDLTEQKTFRMTTNLSSTYVFAVAANSRHVACIEGIAGIAALSGVTIFDLQSKTSTAVPGTDRARSVAIDATGRWLAYDRLSEGWNVYVRDLAQHTTELITVANGTTNAAPTRDSSYPAISHDGRYVVFMSSSDRLVTGDNNRVSDIFVRDRLRGVTLLASINQGGTASGNGPSFLPVLAADGRTLLFQSSASDLNEGDYNEASDVFVLRLGGDDDDGDDMDDEWEVAYFENLSRNGTGDFDGDGVSDVNEQRLGTDPTNAGSVLQVLKLIPEGGPGTKLLWSAVPGRAYRVQFKDNLAPAGWTNAGEIVTAAGTTATWTDLSGSSAQRFYRVLLKSF